MHHITASIINMPMDKFTGEQVAALLLVSPNTVRRFNKVGKLVDGERIKLPRTGIYYYKKDLITFLNKAYDSQLAPAR